jgi:hypothetical protein
LFTIVPLEKSELNFEIAFVVVVVVFAEFFLNKNEDEINFKVTESTLYLVLASSMKIWKR